MPFRQLKQKAFSQTVVNSLKIQNNLFRQLFLVSVQPYSYTKPSASSSSLPVLSCVFLASTTSKIQPLLELGSTRCSLGYDI